MVIATVVAAAATGTARADDLRLSQVKPALPSLSLPAPIPTPPPLPSVPSLPVPIPKPPPLPSVPSLPVPIPKPPALPSLPAAPAPAPPQGGDVSATIPRHAAVRGAAPAARPTGGAASGASASRPTGSSATSASPAGRRASRTTVSRRARSSGTSAAARRRRARRREPSPRKLHRVLAPLAGCVASLGRRQERVLVRRAGLRGFTGASRAETAARLHLSVRRVARLEHRGLRALRRKVRAGACDAPGPAPAVAGTRIGLTPPAPAAPASAPAPAAAAPQQEVKAVHEAGGGNVDVIAEAAPNLRNVAPVAAAEAAVGAGRSYAEEHPFQFALAVLVILMCAVLFVREVRRG
jgi:hypothetical protein